MKTKCEVYSRVVGYIRPVQQWNDGKRAEFDRRRTFDTGKALARAESMGEECLKEKVDTTPALKVTSC